MRQKRKQTICQKRKQRHEELERLRDPEPAMPTQEATKAPEPETLARSWEEIEQSPEYQALPESSKLRKEQEYLNAALYYKDMWIDDKRTLQLDFGRRIRDTEQHERSVPELKHEQPVHR